MGKMFVFKLRDKWRVLVSQLCCHVLFMETNKNPYLKLRLLQLTRHYTQWNEEAKQMNNAEC